MSEMLTTLGEVCGILEKPSSVLILTHTRPDADTLGCAAALCAMLRQMGKTAALLPNAEVTSLYADYVAPYWAAEDYRYETVVSVDLAALGLFPDNAERFKNRVDLAVDHHPSYEGFGKESCVHPECAACGEILYELAVELGQLTPAVALPLYVAVSTDTGCFVYSNVTANTHRVAAALMETGIDYRAANKRHFRTKTKKRLALEAELLRTMEFYDEGRVVVVTLPLSLAERLSLTEADMDDVSALGGVVEGTDCSITMKETKDGAWKISVRTGTRVNATRACAALVPRRRRTPRGLRLRVPRLPCRREGGDPRRRAGCGGGVKSKERTRMNYKKSYQIYRIGLFAVIALIAASLLLQIDWLGIVGVVLFVFDLLQTGIFYRCPNCGKALNFRGPKPKYCPECGEKLDF